MQLTKQNYKTHNAELLAIVEDFKTSHYYFERAAHTILVLIDYNNLKKFEEITCLSSQ